MVRSRLLAVLILLVASDAYAQGGRWILAGDSIMAGVFANEEFGLPGNDAAELAATLISLETGVVIQNISSPGATMSAIPPWQIPGLARQQATLSFIDGLFGARGIIITIGVNDAGQPGIEPSTYLADYTGFVRFARSLGLEVVCVPPLNEPNEPLDPNASRRFRFQLLTVFACANAAVPPENVFNPAAAGIAPDPADPARRRLFASSYRSGQLVLDNVHLSSEGHRLFATKLIDFMVGRGFWTRR
jgi:lysophospholipase L1-like esterase